MNRFKLAIIIGSLGLIIAILHASAIYLFLYWDIPWFDLLMHFLGGLWVGLLGLWFLALVLPEKGILEGKNVIYIALSSAVVVGVAWELFEYYTGLSILEYNFWQDTITDLLMDSAGGVLAGYWVRN
ncbi:MAG: hypothetical protein MRY49_02715 [Candidatus Pacebacteria bacterium]|nr:hypothetical protein [Candidatus Paceibacterota bacterium]